MNAAITLLGVSCYAGHCYSLLISQLHRTIDFLPPLEVYIVLSGIMKARPQEEGFQIRSNLNLLSPASEGCGIFRNRDF